MIIAWNTNIRIAWHIAPTERAVADADAERAVSLYTFSPITVSLPNQVRHSEPGRFRANSEEAVCHNCLKIYQTFVRQSIPPTDENGNELITLRCTLCRSPHRFGHLPAILLCSMKIEVYDVIGED